MNNIGKGREANDQKKLSVSSNQRQEARNQRPVTSDQNYYYLIQIQFLGFRYHGWQKQPHVKTVQGMVEKTLTFVLGEVDFKTLGSSRTDAMVSANQGAFELFTRVPLDQEKLLFDLNLNLPNDIKALTIEEVDQVFNIIQNPKVKEYLYLFSFGQKNHPFCAPFMVYMQEDLDVELMKKGAKLFEGKHNFRKYCCKPSEQTIFDREIMLCEITRNDVYTANFFPENSYMLRVRGHGFLRHQIRLMMGALFHLGKGLVTMEEIVKSLSGTDHEPLSYIAPSSGLILNRVEFDV